ncbi:MULTISPECIES: hypothetical protein [unclassified Lactococcus]|uniref:hypothetical protein n=1 Tax=unclassified Lactococcus TaxID=2643510 RepID=UPI0025808A42|nr:MULTISPECIES: hypothetical protein [unclassified Lactococcus]
MKYNRIVLIFLFLLLSHPVSAQADGRLVLDTSVLTNQKSTGTGTSRFEIRGRIFSEALNKRVEAQKKQSETVSQSHKRIDFTKTHTAPLYTRDFKALKSGLFKDYTGSQIASKEQGNHSENQALWLLLFAALPLLVLTYFVAKGFRRKRYEQAYRD